jgi:hypothetical protein
MEPWSRLQATADRDRISAQCDVRKRRESNPPHEPQPARDNGFEDAPGANGSDDPQQITIDGSATYEDLARLAVAVEDGAELGASAPNLHQTQAKNGQTVAASTAGEISRL